MYVCVNMTISVSRSSHCRVRSKSTIQVYGILYIQITTPSLYTLLKTLKDTIRTTTIIGNVWIPGTFAGV